MASVVNLSRDREQTHRMHQRAMRQITDVLGLCLNSMRRKEQWTCLRREKHQELYVKRTARGVSNGSLVYYLAVNEASCGFEETVDFLHYDSTAQFRFMMKLLHGRDVKEGAILSRRTKEHSLGDWAIDTQHAAIEFLYQDHRKAVLQREQHLTFFQTLKLFRPSTTSLSDPKSPVSTMAGGLNARPTETVHKRTIALNWLPFPRSHETLVATAQVDLHYTLIVEEIASNRLRLSCVTSSFHDKHDGPVAGSPAAVRAIARRLAVHSVGNLETAVVASRVGARQLLERQEWVKNDDRPCCVICWKKFSTFFRRRHHCRLCGEVVCGSCSCLRLVNVSKAGSKTRICHLCYNRAHSTRSTSYHSRKPASTEEWKAPALSALRDLSMEHALPFHELPASLKLVASPYFILPPPSPNDEDEDEEEEEFFVRTDLESSEYEGDSGDLIPLNKIISIKDMTRTRNVRLNLWVDDLNALEVAPSSGQSIDSKSFLHPAARIDTTRSQPKGMITTDVSSSSSIYSSFYPSTDLSIKSKEREDEDKNLDDRRTSLMSSTLGIFDQEEETPSVCLIDATREHARLDLLNLILSPACTLIDRMLMHQSCQLLTSVFHLPAAFLARIHDTFLVVEHVFGSCSLSPQDHVPRAAAVCDLVLSQPVHHPLVVTDCLRDPRTRELAMVQHLRMTHFMGLTVCVRNLPMACLCAYDHENARLEGNEAKKTGPTVSELEKLEKSVDRMEHELERLVQGLLTP